MAFQEYTIPSSCVCLLVMARRSVRAAATPNKMTLKENEEGGWREKTSMGTDTVNE